MAVGIGTNMRFLILFVFFVYCEGNSLPFDEQPIVQTNIGLIRGKKATDGDYNMFLGIPYARVNESNPFGASIAVSPFEEVFDAVQDTVRCMQITEILSKEVHVDCLQLNVFVPKSASATNKLPVVIWIHGGGFMAGWGGIPITGPKFLVKQDVILVSLNYRLGIYGFMCLDVLDVPGNQGLKDQINGIKWVKENIDNFGGDSDKITIMGESAGGVAVDYLLRFNEPKLFNQVIIQSGTSNGQMGVPGTRNYKYAINLARLLGFKTDDTIQALKYLATVDPKKLVIFSMLDPMSISGPCIEKDMGQVDRLVTEDPSATTIKNAKTTPILIGYNSAEMGLMVPMNSLFYSENVYQQIAESFGFTNEKAKEIATKIRRFYVGDVQKRQVGNEEMTQYINAYSDLRFIYSTEQAVDSYVNNGATKVYRYVFSYVGDRSYYHILTKPALDGAVHGEELCYLFDISLLNQPISDQDQTVIDQLTTMWTNFIKYGDPTPQTSKLLPVKWPQITPDFSYYIDIGKELVVSTRPNKRRMAFLDVLNELGNSYTAANNIKVEKLNTSKVLEELKVILQYQKGITY